MDKTDENEYKAIFKQRIRILLNLSPNEKKKYTDEINKLFSEYMGENGFDKPKYDIANAKTFNDHLQLLLQIEPKEMIPVKNKKTWMPLFKKRTN